MKLIDGDDPEITQYGRLTPGQGHSERTCELCQEIKKLMDVLYLICKEQHAHTADCYDC